MVSASRLLSVNVFEDRVFMSLKPEEALLDLWILYVVMPVWVVARSQSSFKLLSLTKEIFKLATLMLPSTHFAAEPAAPQPKLQLWPEPVGPEPRPSQVFRKLPSQ